MSCYTAFESIIKGQSELISSRLLWATFVRMGISLKFEVRETARQRKDEIMRKDVI